MAKLSKAELAKREDIIQKMKKNKRSLVKRYGPDAEKVMYGRATNIAKKVAESEMENINLKELVRTALMQEKKKPFPDLTGDGKVTKADILKARGVDLKEGNNLQIGDTIQINPEAFPSFEFPKGTRGEIIDINKADYASDDLVYRVKIYHIDGQGDPATELYVEDSNQYLEEDMDLGHTDNEPHMLKGDLYRIGKYAMELYQMVDEFEGKGEVDFPHWWQSKIIKAKEMMSSAKHYLDFETKEPQIDAMVGAIDMSGALDNVGVDEIQTDMFATKASKTDSGKETYFKFLRAFAKSAGKSEEELRKMSYNDLEKEFGVKLARKHGLKKINVADKARELVDKGVIQVDEIEEGNYKKTATKTLAKKLAKQLKSR